MKPFEWALAVSCFFALGIIFASVHLNDSTGDPIDVAEGYKKKTLEHVYQRADELEEDIRALESMQREIERECFNVQNR